MTITKKLAWSRFIWGRLLVCRDADEVGGETLLMRQSARAGKRSSDAQAEADDALRVVEGSIRGSQSNAKIRGRRRQEGSEGRGRSNSAAEQQAQECMVMRC